MGKFRRHVGLMQDFGRQRCLAIEKKQFRKRNRSDAVAWIGFTQRLAYGARPVTAPVPHEKPNGCQQKLSLFLVHLSSFGFRPTSSAADRGRPSP